MPNSTSAPRAGAGRRGWATRAATTRASGGGSAGAARTRCAAPGEAAPLMTGSSTAAAANRAVRRSQGPGLGTGEPPSQVAQRPGAGHIRQPLEVPGGRRGRRVTLEGGAAPRGVGRSQAGGRWLDDVVHEEDQTDGPYAPAHRREAGL